MPLLSRDGVVFDHAVACERAGRFMSSIGETNSATRYLRQANESYREWGARIKVDQLELELLSR